MTRTESTIENDDVLDLLTSLVDKSLVLYDESTGRYRLLETVHQYGRDRMLEAGNGEVWRDQHLVHFLTLAEDAEPHLTGRDQAEWLDRLEREHDNLRVALEWTGQRAGSAEAGLRLAGAFWRFWDVRGYLGEGRGWLAGLLSADAGDPAGSVRAKALNAAGILAYRQADYTGAQALHEKSLAIRRELGDQWGVASSLNNLGLVTAEQADHASSRAFYEESLAIKRELGDRAGIAVSLNNVGITACYQADYPAAWTLHEESLEIKRELGDRWGIASSLCNLGMVARELGDYTAARDLYQQSLAIWRDFGDPRGIAALLNNLGEVAFEQADYSAARTLHKESLGIFRDLGELLGIANSLEGLAALPAGTGAPRHTSRIWGAAERLREAIGAPLPPNERSRYQRKVFSARAALGDAAAFDRAWQQGRAMTVEQAIKYALSSADD